MKAEWCAYCQPGMHCPYHGCWDVNNMGKDDTKTTNKLMKTFSDTNQKLVSKAVGKIIKSIDAEACNCLEVTFTDGTSLFLESVTLLPSVGLHGIEVSEGIKP